MNLRAALHAGRVHWDGLFASCPDIISCKMLLPSGLNCRDHSHAGKAAVGVDPICYASAHRLVAKTALEITTVMFGQELRPISRGSQSGSPVRKRKNNETQSSDDETKVMESLNLSVAHFSRKF